MSNIESMYETINQHVDNALSEYSQGDHLDTLLEAKKVYTEVTGPFNEEDADFEARMNCFNDWYVFNFHTRGATHPIIKDYVETKNIEDNLSDAFGNINYSLFEFVKTNFKKRMVIKDILHNEKFVLSVNHPKMGIIANDIFVGRILTCDEDAFLLKGLCIFPPDVKPVLMKESKRIRKMNEKQRELNFLMQLESLKVRWQRYGHLDVKQIFVFD